jgi:hypothetical protein
MHKAKSRNSPKILVGKHEGTKQLARPLEMWKDNVNTDLKETGCEDVASIHLVHNRKKWWNFVTTVMEIPSVTE